MYACLETNTDRIFCMHGGLVRKNRLVQIFPNRIEINVRAGKRNNAFGNRRVFALRPADHAERRAILFYRISREIIRFDSIILNDVFRNLKATVKQFVIGLHRTVGKMIVDLVKRINTNVIHV